MRFFLLAILATTQLYATATSFGFGATKEQPYHLSVGAVLFNEEGAIACHHFKEIMGQKDIYILIRESMEDGETILMTLERGLKEEFGASAEPVAFLGALSGFLKDPVLSFDKTTLYIACRLKEWDPAKRDADDPEGMSLIEWLPPEQLISIMEEQGRRFKRVDADESEMIKRALPYLSLGGSINR